MKTNSYKFNAIDAMDFLQQDCRPQYLVEGLISKRSTVTVIGGRDRIHRRAMVVDLCAAMLTATPWLGCYAVPDHHRLLVIDDTFDPAPCGNAIATTIDNRPNCELSQTPGKLYQSQYTPWYSDEDFERFRSIVADGNVDTVVIHRSWGLNWPKDHEAVMQLRRVSEITSRANTHLVLIIPTKPGLTEEAAFREPWLAVADGWVCFERKSLERGEPSFPEHVRCSYRGRGVGSGSDLLRFDGPATASFVGQSSV